MRAILELIITIVVVIAARAILTNLFQGIAGGVSRSAPSPGKEQPSPPKQSSGDLHKDPVCGTYVAESTPFRRQSSGQTFYYCSEACREKHSLVAR